MTPSLALQGLTTREPDDSQIECAIVALERVLRTDGVEKYRHSASPVETATEITHVPISQGE